MSELRITGAPLVKTADQRRAERRARRARRHWPSVVLARGAFWVLALLALVGADRVEAGVRVLLNLVR